MWLDHYQAERLMEQRVKDALHQARQERMIRMAEEAHEVRPRHLPLHFILGCQVDTSKDRWEPTIGREQYSQWRDALIKVGWAEWVNRHEQERGWKLARPASEIMQMVFLA
jgi:hypothetical protein